VLTTNHVFEILLRWASNGGDWGKAVVNTAPKRGHGKREKFNEKKKSGKKKKETK